MRVYVDQARIDSYESLPALTKNLIRPLAAFDGEVVTPVPLEDLDVFGDSLLNYLDYAPVNVLDTKEGFAAARATESVRLQTYVEQLPREPVPVAPIVDWFGHLTRVATATESYAIGKPDPERDGRQFSWKVAAPKQHVSRFVLLVDPYMFAKSRRDESVARLVAMLEALVRPIPGQRLQLVLMYRWDTVGKSYQSAGPAYDRDANSKLWRALKNAVKQLAPALDIAFVNVLYSARERSHDRFAITQQYLLDGGAAILRLEDSPHLSRLRISYHSGRLRKCPDVVRRIEEFEHVLQRYVREVSNGQEAKDYVAMSSVADLLESAREWRGIMGL